MRSSVALFDISLSYYRDHVVRTGSNLIVLDNVDNYFSFLDFDHQWYTVAVDLIISKFSRETSQHKLGVTPSTRIKGLDFSKST